jgi:hypothetical protein
METFGRLKSRRAMLQYHLEGQREDNRLHEVLGQFSKDNIRKNDRKLKNSFGHNFQCHNVNEVEMFETYISDKPYVVVNGIDLAVEIAIQNSRSFDKKKHVILQ